ncbi:hypothetical protein B2G69_07775 [Methylorubrum zatmanii]|nr:Rha family transcriptional regulator [Methylorubrum zatmanii]ARO54053.1 hypothetical protein B2G69_07775 [Methylorubrum zatmanii]
MNQVALTSTTNFLPPVTLIDGKVAADSRDVASLFGKRHDNVIRDIRGLLKIEETPCGSYFQETTYIDPQNGRSYTRFLMDRDGFSILAMGFTGVRAMQWKVAYLGSFNAMEATLRDRPAAPAFDANDPAALRTVLLGYTEQLLLARAENAEIKAENAEVRQALVVVGERAEMAEAHVAAVAPKAAFVEADGHYGLHNAARALGAPPQGFVDWLKQGFLFYQDRELMPRATFVTIGVFAVRARLIDGRARSRTVVTPRGLQYLGSAWQRHLLKTGKGKARTLFDDAA